MCWLLYFFGANLGESDRDGFFLSGFEFFFDFLYFLLISLGFKLGSGSVDIFDPDHGHSELFFTDFGGGSV